MVCGALHQYKDAFDLKQKLRDQINLFESWKTNLTLGAKLKDQNAYLPILHFYTYRSSIRHILFSFILLYLQAPSTRASLLARAIGDRIYFTSVANRCAIQLHILRYFRPLPCCKWLEAMRLCIGSSMPQLSRSTTERCRTCIVNVDTSYHFGEWVTLQSLL